MGKLGPQLESFDRLKGGGGGVSRGLTAVSPTYATSNKAIKTILEIKEFLLVTFRL